MITTILLEQSKVKKEHRTNYLPQAEMSGKGCKSVVVMTVCKYTHNAKEIVLNCTLLSLFSTALYYVIELATKFCYVKPLYDRGTNIQYILQ